MPRINLSVDDALFIELEKRAMSKKTTVNLLIIDLLENLYADSAMFNYSASLKTLVDEAEIYAENHENGDEFTLANLSSFTNISIVQAGKSNVRPTMVRARLGKMFNAKVCNGNVKGVARAKNSLGKEKFINKTVIYVVVK